MNCNFMDPRFRGDDTTGVIVIPAHAGIHLPLNQQIAHP